MGKAPTSSSTGGNRLESWNTKFQLIYVILTSLFYYANIAYFIVGGFHLSSVIIASTLLFHHFEWNKDMNIKKTLIYSK